MDENIETMKYFIASEKVQNMIFTIEMSLEYLEEYKIEPDEMVKKTLGPVVKQLTNWLEKPK